MAQLQSDQVAPCAARSGSGTRNCCTSYARNHTDTERRDLPCVLNPPEPWTTLHNKSFPEVSTIIFAYQSRSHDDQACCINVSE